jgi:hypothetical protein
MLTESKNGTTNKGQTKTVEFKGGVVSSQSVSQARIGIDGIVSGTNVQQTKSQIPKPKGSK